MLDSLQLQGLIIGGDMNTYSYDVPDKTKNWPPGGVVNFLKASLTPPLHEVSAEIPQSQRYTHGYGNYGAQLDHILISDSLKGLVKKVWIDHSGAYKTTQAGNHQGGGSDHWPFLVTLELPTKFVAGAPLQARIL